MEAQL
jgi:hypothetical protein